MVQNDVSLFKPALLQYTKTWKVYLVVNCYESIKCYTPDESNQNLWTIAVQIHESLEVPKFISMRSTTEFKMSWLIFKMRWAQISLNIFYKKRGQYLAFFKGLRKKLMNSCKSAIKLFFRRFECILAKMNLKMQSKRYEAWINA